MTPLTLHEAKQAAKILDQGGKMMFISRSYTGDKCPYKVRTAIDLVMPNQKEPFAQAIIKSIRPDTFEDRKGNDARAKREGFTNAKAWESHYKRRHGHSIPGDRKVFTLQLHMEALRKPKKVDMNELIA